MNSKNKKVKKATEHISLVEPSACTNKNCKFQEYAAHLRLKNMDLRARDSL